MPAIADPLVVAISHLDETYWRTEEPTRESFLLGRLRAAVYEAYTRYLVALGEEV
jgi:hypothetical protein